MNRGGKRRGAGAPRKPEEQKKIQRMVGFDRASFNKTNSLAKEAGCSRALVVRAMILLSDDDDVLDVIDDLRG